MLLSAVALGIHDRRRNPRFLLAAFAPWLFFVAFCPQTHERYGLYPALLGTVLVALSPRWALLGIAIQFIAIVPPLKLMLQCGDRFSFLDGQGDRLLTAIDPLTPGLGWAMVTIALMCLYSLMDLRRPRVRH
jgi:hypothetical protein